MKEEALELADYLDNNVEAMYLSEQPHLDKASDMIRKLVAKIEVTERDYNFMKDYAIGLEKVEKDLKAELEEKEYRVKELTKRYSALARPELDKQGEPVALCCDLDDYRMVNIAEKMGLDPADKMFLSLPLYTAPQTKPLSDEEIYKFAENCGFNIDGKAINDGIETAADFSYELFKFARAIEERHGIK